MCADKIKKSDLWCLLIHGVCLGNLRAQAFKACPHVIVPMTGWVVRMNSFFLALIWSCQKNKKGFQFLKQCWNSHSLCLTLHRSFFSALLHPVHFWSSLPVILQTIFSSLGNLSYLSALLIRDVLMIIWSKRTGFSSQAKNSSTQYIWQFVRVYETLNEEVVTKYLEKSFFIFAED